MLILQSKNIILIDKLIIYKIIKGTRKVDLFWLIDYGYRLVSGPEQCLPELIGKLSTRKWNVRSRPVATTCFI